MAEKVENLEAGAAANNNNNNGDDDNGNQSSTKNYEKKKDVFVKLWNNLYCLFVLRVLAILATLAATVIMALNKQKKTLVVATIGTTPIQATLTAKFNHTPAFIFFVIANGMVSLHNLLMLIVEAIGHKFDKKGLRFSVIPILDMMNVGLISGGASGALFMGELGRDGNSHARWNKICDKFQSYCNRGSGALVASFLGLLFMITLNFITISKLRKFKYNSN